MPKFNPSGTHIASGVGGATFSIDNVAVCRGGNAAWLDDRTVLHGRFIGGSEDDPANWQVWSYDIVTQQSAMVDPRGVDARSLVAGGGRWQGWSSRYGCFGSLGDLPGASVIAAGLDGTLAIKPNYQSGLGFDLYAPGGVVTHGGDGSACYGLRVIGATNAIWIDGLTPDGDIVTHAGRFKQYGPAMTPALIAVDGEVWLAYYTRDLGIIAHPAYAPDDPRPLMGYVLGPTEHAYGYDVIAAPGAILVTTPPRRASSRVRPL